MVVIRRERTHAYCGVEQPIGQVSASLAAMARTVDDYDSMAKREIIKAKQEKAMMYVYRAYYLLLYS